MHPLEIAEHGLQERRVIYPHTVKVSFVKKRKRLITLKKARKYIKKRNKKFSKKLWRFLFPNAYNPTNLLT